MEILVRMTKEKVHVDLFNIELVSNNERFRYAAENIVGQRKCPTVFLHFNVSVFLPVNKKQ